VGGGGFWGGLGGEGHTWAVKEASGVRGRVVFQGRGNPKEENRKRSSRKKGGGTAEKAERGRSLSFRGQTLTEREEVPAAKKATSFSKIEMG